MTRDPDLDVLLTPDFEVSVVSSTPAVLRRRLQKSPHLRKLLQRYDQGLLGDDELRSFVSGLLREHRSPDEFPHQTALAAIAVMLEQRRSRFAEEYVADLARVRTARMAIASRVARLCNESRMLGTSNVIGSLPPIANIPQGRFARESTNGASVANAIYEVTAWRN